MGEPRTAKFDKRQRDALENMEDDGIADNQSDAIRTAVDAGLAELGYANGSHDETRLEWLAAELARIFAYLGLGWLAATLYFPVGFRLYAVGWFVISLAFVGLERLLETYEPSLSNRLTELFAGGDTTS